MLVHTIERATHPSPTCISPLSITGETFVVSYSDASILIFDTRTGEEIIGMASGETYDGTPATSVNSVVATSVGLEGTMSMDSGRGVSEDESAVHGATGSSGGGGVEGVVISGHEDQFIRFFDANSGKWSFCYEASFLAQLFHPQHT
jgi:striatin 1/3/4